MTSDASTKSYRNFWTNDEHRLFIEGLLKFGRDKKKIAAHI